MDCAWRRYMLGVLTRMTSVHTQRLFSREVPCLVTLLVDRPVPNCHCSVLTMRKDSLWTGFRAEATYLGCQRIPLRCSNVTLLHYTYCAALTVIIYSEGHTLLNGTTISIALRTRAKGNSIWKQERQAFCPLGIRTFPSRL